MGWLPEEPVLAAEYCECESTKIAGIKRRVVEMEKTESKQSEKTSSVCVFVMSERVTAIPSLELCSISLCRRLS